MLVNCDAKALEWVTLAELSQDPVAKRELEEKIDQHTSNQSLFNLPTRKVAKLYLFR